MGAWGTGLFSNDTAADLRQDFRDCIADGLDAESATSRLISEYEIGNGADDDNDFWLALAVTQHGLGRVTPEVMAHALRIVDDATELARWSEVDRRKRHAVLVKVRETLLQPQPPPKPVRRRKLNETTLEPGQHVRWRLGHGKPDALLRVVDIHKDKGGRAPVMLALEWSQSPQEALIAHRLPALAGGYDQMRRREVALGFIVFNKRGEPSGLQVLEARSDEHTEPVSQFRWVTWWDDLHRFFTAHGDAAIPPEPHGST